MWPILPTLTVSSYGMSVVQLDIAQLDRVCTSTGWWEGPVCAFGGVVLGLVSV